ncbi:S-4TM family putative pore-forming effector [Blastococcus sp. BMG 814]|uniref:S-4TM family putative pore-forming effector n=1 Tax=Blastococcus carthaginiensis TaxID=3050034 RepID=A0ABT9IAP9_9ACTN|nr:S-4TM family putative pore-forming effector [Blastococcus carthaginiensis]MDP5182244.1 S-4TM family putative pore-forming effector [Blastococcus carthaginiensis]
MPGPVRRTEPPITEQQNTEAFLRLLAAQRRLYADVKASHNRRLIALAVIAAATIVVGVFAPSARNYIGGTVAIGMGLWAVLGEVVEKRKNGTAASIQEEFDTGLFRLDRHPYLATRPSDWEITEAANRGSRDGLPNWYQPRSLSDLVRPLDVLVCQRANLDYGVSLHRAYARLLVLVLGVVLALAVTVGFTFQYTLLNWVFALVAPLAATAAALVKEAVLHRESATNKATLQTKVAELWRRALDDPATVTDTDCRAAQDRILQLRQSNARVPDWFYKRRWGQNESTMLANSSHLVEEARARGHVLPNADDI